MINIDFANIDNAKLIGRLLPFWARGRKTSLFLQAILSPIASAHEQFKVWALQIFLECHITAQKSSLEWYLKYRLKSHFHNENDTFFITQGVNESLSCFSNDVWRNGLHWDNDLRWDVDTEPLVIMNMNLSCINTGLWENRMLWSNAFLWCNEDNGKKYNDDYLESVEYTNVYAPAIVDTVNYNHEDYERDIRNIMSNFMINFKKINIIIADTEQELLIKEKYENLQLRK